MFDLSKLIYDKLLPLFLFNLNLTVIDSSPKWNEMATELKGTVKVGKVDATVE